MIDSGATGYVFVDEEYAQEHQLPVFKLPEPRRLEVIDGRTAISDVTHATQVQIRVGGHVETAPMFITRLAHYPIVFGIPWMRQHDVHLDFKANTLTFESDYCQENCGIGPVPMVVHGITSALPSSQTRGYALVAGAVFARMASKPEKYGVEYTGSFTIKDLRLALAAVKEEQQARAIAEKSLRDKDKLAKYVPREYHDLSKMFSKSEADKLPPHGPYDHKIPLKEGFVPPFGPLYGLSKNELETLHKWLEDNLNRGLIRASSSPAGAPILFVKKKDGTLRLCVDYRGLNEGTIKNRYPLPLIKETLNMLCQAKYYTTLDVRDAYGLVRIAEEDVWKTAFRTRWGLFETLIMPFGLTNAPADFQRYINNALRPFLDHFCTAYLDDVLVFSNTLSEHKRHVRQVLEALEAFGLRLKPEKCLFHKTSVAYLGYIVSRDGIAIDLGKVRAVREWTPCKDLHDVRAFLGFANFYRRFIRGYSGIVRPLTALTQKGVKFKWSEECQGAFDELKEAFTTAPVLAHFNPDAEILVETDASDFVSAGVLSQRGKDGVWHPVAFFSKKHIAAECNYEIYDKELMAIVRCFEEWRAQLESAPHPIQVLTDHKNLEYFMTSKLLNRRQARWSEFLSRFDFKIKFRPGKLNTKADALTRRSGDRPDEGDERLLQQEQAVLKPRNLPKPLAIAANNKEDVQAEHPGTIDEMWAEGAGTDRVLREIVQALRTGAVRSPHITLSLCKEEEGRLFYQNRLYVPRHALLRSKLIRDHHETPAAGHPGRSKTLDLLSRSYYWPNMRKDVDRFVRNCHPCQRSCTARHAPYGVLRPLAVPTS